MSRPILFPRLLGQMWGLVLVALLLLPAGTAYAAPLGQDEAGTPLLLGQYAFDTVAAGESRVFELAIAEAGSYFVTAVDEAASEAGFDVVVTDAAGTVLYDDVFVNTELALEPGTVTLEFIAVEDADLLFVVVGSVGTMTGDPEQPGKLGNGSVYAEEGVSQGRYALLSIPATSYPQQVLLYVEAGEEDSFYVYVEGDDVGYADLSTDDGNILSFWTHGGDYLVSVEPSARRSSFTLIAFLNRQPTPLTLGEPLEASIPAAATEVVFELQLDTTVDNLLLEVASDQTLGVRLVDHYYDAEVNYDSYGEPMLEVPNLFPGVYYVFVTVPEPAPEDIPFTLTVGGSAGQALGVLESGVPSTGTFEAGQASATYTFEVAQPGAMVDVLLESTSQETDFDISAGLRPGEEIWYTYAYGSNESLSFIAPVAGTYYITVQSNEGVGDYDLTATEGDLAPALENNSVIWDTVAASSRNVYRLEVTEPGQLLALALVGSPEVDLDVYIAAYNADGEQIAYASGSSGGSVEMVGQVLTEPGVYEVTVTSYFYEGDTAYFLRTQLLDPSLLGGQWAVDATASSQFGDSDYAPTQATGPQDTFEAADSPTAWTSLEADAGEETLELTYQFPVTPYAVEIYESYNPGAVVAVEAYDAASDAWVVVWEGEAQAVEEAYRVHLVSLDPVDFRTDRIRLTLDTAAVDGWNEIDAVQLFGRP